MEHPIQFCKTADGVRIAYLTMGQGPAIIIVPGWISHIQLQVANPSARAFFEKMGRKHTIVFYDKHGCGLSERDRTEFSLESEVTALEAVVSHFKLKRFVIFGLSQSGPIAIAYTVKHPRRVSHLLLYDTYACGETITKEEIKIPLIALVRSHWGIGSKTLTDLFFPGGGADETQMFALFQREAASAEMAAKLLELTYRLDATNLLSKIHVPTLVMHRRGDRAVPFRCGREMAAMIPNVRFVPLEGDIHFPNLGDSEAVLRNIAEFLGDPIEAYLSKPTSGPAIQIKTATEIQPAESEALNLIFGLDEVALSRYYIVGDYTRYDEGMRNTLKDARARIAAGCLQPSRKRENHLIWAAPGSGKTYFVQQISVTLPGPFGYKELNLAKCNEQEFHSGLSGFDEKETPFLCFIDECDAKPQEPWPYEMLLPYLDASVERGTPIVFVLAGSSGKNLAELKQRMAVRPKGSDLLSRIPAGNEYEIMPLNIGDRILVVLNQFRQVGKEFNREIRSVEKLGLYYVALTPRLANARQLREFAVRAVERVPPNDDRIKYDHLFSAGDPENKAFWMQAQPSAGGLVNSFAMLKD